MNRLAIAALIAFIGLGAIFLVSGIDPTDDSAVAQSDAVEVENGE